MQLKFGLSVPSHLWHLSVGEKIATANAIADAGFDHIFMADHVSFRDGSGTDGFIDVAALSQLHDSLGVMISIYLLPLRHPLPVARQMLSMDKVASGRFILGVGIGGEDRHEVEVCGVDPATRGARTNESLEIIRQLLQGETVDYDGEHFKLDQAVIRPTPRAPIPIIVGGRSNAALQRTARYGEGWIATWCSTKRFTDATQSISEQAAALGRPDVDWLHGYQPWVGVADTKARAREIVAKQMEDFYKVPFEKFERYTPFGTPSEVAAQLGEYAKAGCRLFNLKVCAERAEDEVVRGAEVVEEISRLA